MLQIVSNLFLCSSWVEPTTINILLFIRDAVGGLLGSLSRRLLGTLAIGLGERGDVLVRLRSRLLACLVGLLRDLLRSLLVGLLVRLLVQLQLLDCIRHVLHLLSLLLRERQECLHLLSLRERLQCATSSDGRRSYCGSGSSSIHA